MPAAWVCIYIASFLATPSTAAALGPAGPDAGANSENRRQGVLAPGLEKPSFADDVALSDPTEARDVADVTMVDATEPEVLRMVLQRSEPSTAFHFV